MCNRQFFDPTKNQAGKGDSTASRTNHKALWAGWDRMNKAIVADKKKKKRKKK